MSHPDVRWTMHAFGLMRIIVGVLFLCHGLSKWTQFPAPAPPGMPPLLAHVAGTIELVCGALVALGLFTRWAALIASGEMAVAYFTAHLPRGVYPIANGGELAVLYCFVFLFVSQHGGGVWSLDAQRQKPVPGLTPCPQCEP